MNDADTLITTPKGDSKTKLKTVIFFILLQALIPLSSLAIYSYLGTKQTAINQAQHDIESITKNMSWIYAQKIENTEYILKILSKSPQIQQGNLNECDAYLAETMAEFKNYVNFAYIKTNGDIVCSALPFLQPLNASDRPYFQHAIQNNTFSVGTYQIGKVTKKPAINFAYPVTFEEKTTGVVVAALDLEWVKQFVNNSGLPSNSVVLLIDADSTVLARYPEEPNLVGSKLDIPLIKTALEKHNGSDYFTGLDGNERYFTFSQITDPLYGGEFHLFIGVPTDVIYANANQTFARNLAMTLGIFIFSFLITFTYWKIFFSKRKFRL